MEKQRVLVIGAGPAGLVSLKTLREQGYDAVCFEDSTDVGGTFVNKANYDDGKLVSSKYITPFSDFRLPARCACQRRLGTIV
jgi:dimethylaniline monooxygenase (N-oxide forming)